MQMLLKFLYIHELQETSVIDLSLAFSYGVCVYMCVCIYDWFILNFFLCVHTHTHTNTLKQYLAYGEHYNTASYYCC